MIYSKCKMCGETEGKELLNVSQCTDTYLDYLKIEYKTENRFYKKCNNCGFVYRSLFLTDDEKELLYSSFRDEGLRNETHKEYFERISSYPKENSEYIYSSGWNYKAIYSLIIWFIFSVSTIWNANLTSLQSFGWIIGAFVSAITYYLLAKD